MLQDKLQDNKLVNEIKSLNAELIQKDRFPKQSMLLAKGSGDGRFVASVVLLKGMEGLFPRL